MKNPILHFKNNLLKQQLTGILLCCTLLCHGQVKVSKDLFLPLPENVTQISSYQDGMAKVRTKGGSFGYLDTIGHFAITPQEDLDEAGDFKNGFTWVGKYFGDTLLYGFMNKLGKIVVPFKYKEVESFYEGRAAVYDDLNGWQVIDSTGKVIIPDSLLITEMPVWGDGEKPSWQDIEPPHFQEGLMQCRRDGKYGYMDLSGKLAIACRFLKVNDFTDGVALVAKDTVAYRLPDADKVKSGKLSQLDRLYLDLESGPPSYKWALIDRTGLVICPIDSSLSPDVSRGFHQGLLPFQDAQNKWGFMNAKGKIIIAARFDNEPTDFCDGVCIVQVPGHAAGGKDGYMILIGINGQQVAKIPFCTAAGCLYDSGLAFHEGLMAVRIGQSWGYMDKKGSLVIPPDFETAMDFHNGRAIVVTAKGQVKVIRNSLK